MLMGCDRQYHVAYFLRYDIDLLMYQCPLSMAPVLPGHEPSMGLICGKHLMRLNLVRALHSAVLDPNYIGQTFQMITAAFSRDGKDILDSHWCPDYFHEDKIERYIVDSLWTR